MPETIKKGQKLFLVICNRKSAAEIRETTVVSCGHKYFSVHGWPNKFLVESHREVTQYSSYAYIYMDKQKYFDEKEHSQTLAFLQKTFDWHNSIGKKLPLEKLRQIKQIIET